MQKWDSSVKFSENLTHAKVRVKSNFSLKNALRMTHLPLGVFRRRRRRGLFPLAAARQAAAAEQPDHGGQDGDDHHPDEPEGHDGGQYQHDHVGPVSRVLPRPARGPEESRDEPGDVSGWGGAQRGGGEGRGSPVRGGTVALHHHVLRVDEK